MELTRRDALAALAAAGVGGGAAVLADDEVEAPTASDHSSPLSATDVATLVSAAEVLYPSAVENVEGFVTEYVRGRAIDRPDHAAGMADAVGYLDAYARSWYDDPFGALAVETREAALERMNADVADPDPEGSDVERVRYYVVDELLFALFSSPTGGKLVGLENPEGYPGGTDSYQRGPNVTGRERNE
ncbi:MAG: gluconate 2-dehydrogenase subunit 3 family protein [Haloarculaceae archaeon]